MPRKTLLDLHSAPSWPQDVVYGGEHVLVVGRYFFLVESASEPGSFHCVDLEPVEDEVGHCTCRSGETRKTCRHERVVREFCGLPS